MRRAKLSNLLQTRRVTGITLVELMVVISIMSILMALAAPSFTRLLSASKVQRQSESLLSDLRYARSVAMRRGGSVTMCASSNPLAAAPTCVTADPNWAAGWIIFVDNTIPLNNDYNATTDELLRRQEPFSDVGATDTGTGGAVGKPPIFIRFNGEGRLVGLQGSFILRSSDSDTTLNRAICVATTGRARVTATGTTTC